MKQVIKDTLKDIPQNPGVYLMKDTQDNIIYIGKAKNLKNRVKSYFVKGNNSIKTWALVDHVCKIDWVVTDSENEAFALESNLIKQFMPRYNIMLKDDKHYPYIKINLKTDYPKIEIVRRVKKDGAKYFGPYFDATGMRKMVDVVNKTFKIRTCSRNITKTKGKERPCLENDIGRCIAPCLAEVSKKEYRDIIYEVVDFLSGDVDKVKLTLKEKMSDAAEKMQYEKAAQLRDRLIGIEKAQNQGQRVIAASDENFDLFAVCKDDIRAVVQALIIRNGKVIGSESFEMEMPEGGEPSEILEYYVNSYYTNQNIVPIDVFISNPFPDMESTENYLSQLRSGPVHMHIPERGKKKRLMEMAYENARQELARIKLSEERKHERTGGAVISLKDELKLKKVPRRIEGFDISNIQGVDTVASMVVFEDGVPKKSDYRRFKIKTVEGPDDFKSMAEVVKRRFERLLKSEANNDSFSKCPDFVLIDGGKGQLSSARKVMKDMGFGHIDTIGLAKREEEVFVGDGQDLVLLDKRAPALHLLQRIRDEAHRFAIAYHRSLRNKNSYRSVLDDIEKIGKKRKKALLMVYPTVSAIKNADYDDLLQVEGMSKDAAKSVFEYFNAGKGKKN